MTPKKPDLKRDARHLSPEELLGLRSLGIALLKKGVKMAAIARQLGVNRNTVLRWKFRLNNFPEEQAVLGDKRGPKEETAEKMFVLTKAQQAVVRSIVIDKNPNQYKFEFALWTLKAVKLLIKKLYQIEVANSTLSSYLKSWGMTPQRPAKRALRQNSELVENWLQEGYPAIARRAQAENALIYWQDETGIHQDTNWIRGYAPKGQTPVIQHDGRMDHGCPNMLSAISNQGKLHFSIHKGAVDAKVFLQFLKDLVADNKGRKIFVIADNARIHHACIVTEWLNENKNLIELFFLPPYTPEHNPDEYLNRQVKTNLRNKPAMNHEEAIKATEQLLREMADFGGKLIRRLFESPLVQYARACEVYPPLALSYSK